MAADAPTLYFLDAQSQPQGPLPRDAVAGMVASGALSGATMAWYEGAPAWVPLEQLLGGGGAPAGGAAATVARHAVRAAPPSRDDPDAELRAFQAEMARLEDEAAADERPATPEEKSFVDDDGTAYVWDAARRVFVPQEGGAAGSGGVDAALPSYDPEQMVFPGDDEPPLPVPPPRAAAEGLDAEDDAEEEDAAVAAAAAARAALDPAARARAEAVDRERARLKAKEEARAAAAAAKAADPTAPKVNTSVYVTGLPDDATAEEMATVFGRCGLIKEDDAGQPRVKLYTDKATGMLKGDGLVIYLKEPSVALACTILDGAQFRPGRGKAMSVTPAKFDIKVKSAGAKEPKKPKPAAGAAAGGGRKRKAGADVDKALGWDGFDDVVDTRKVIVVLKGMFEPAEMAAGGAAAAETLRAEVVAECATFGAVDKARVFARNPEGVVTVRFREPDAAEACRQRMHGRFFGGRALQAAMYDGRTDFEPPRRAETEEEQAARLERYAAELEKEFDGDA